MKCAILNSIFKIFPGLFLALVIAIPGYAHWGYVDARLESETSSRILESIALQPVKDPEEVLFDSDVMEELQDRYYREFGFSKAEIGLSQMEYFFQHNQTIGNRADTEGYRERQQDFGEYVVNRFGEKYLDEYMKKSPRLAPAYQVKTRITQVRVSPQEKVELKADYNLSGNYAEIEWIHPAYKLEFTVDFIRGEIGPTDPQEYTFRATKSWDPWNLDLYHRSLRKLTDLVLSWNIQSNLQFQWQSRWDLTEEEGAEQDRRTYIGLSYVF